MARTLLRLVVGLLFVGHGTQKLFGWFGGHGPEGTGQFFESGGLRPGQEHAQLAGASETAGSTRTTARGSQTTATSSSSRMHSPCLR